MRDYLDLFLRIAIVRPAVRARLCHRRHRDATGAARALHRALLADRGGSGPLPRAAELESPVRHRCGGHGHLQPLDLCAAHRPHDRPGRPRSSRRPIGAGIGAFVGYLQRRPRPALGAGLLRDARRRRAPGVSGVRLRHRPGGQPRPEPADGHHRHRLRQRADLSAADALPGDGDPRHALCRGRAGGRASPISTPSPATSSRMPWARSWRRSRSTSAGRCC